MRNLKLHEQEIVANFNCTILYVNNCNCFLVSIRITEFDDKSGKKAACEISISSSGQLRLKNSVKDMNPSGLY